MTFRLYMDTNGNKVLSVVGARISVQTNGNLPTTHAHGVCEETRGEIEAYIGEHGTESQRRTLGLL
tara:strand:- start:297 stop:494 length:198 start_codon:yes stop_codon:yes gene_type:complete